MAEFNFSISLNLLRDAMTTGFSKVPFIAQMHEFEIIVDGAPVTLEFAEVIEADDYGENAPHTVETVHKLVAAHKS